MADNVISINIWDDYCDDGYVPIGEIQKTYAYVESQIEENACKNILELLKKSIEDLAKPEWSLNLYLNYYDSAKTHPNLIGTEHEWCLYKRWQLQIEHISHEAREYLVDALKNQKLNYQEQPIVVYSES